MKHAINELKMILEIAKTNEPIQRSEGNLERADYNRARALDIATTLLILDDLDSGKWKLVQTEKGVAEDGLIPDGWEKNWAYMAQINAFENSGPYAKEFAEEQAALDAKRSVDDDLGELDPTKACKIDNPDCESCS